MEYRIVRADGSHVAERHPKTPADARQAIKLRDHFHADEAPHRGERRASPEDLWEPFGG